MANNCITIEAEIYGMIPNAKIDALEKAPLRTYPTVQAIRLLSAPVKRLTLWDRYPEALHTYQNGI